MLTIYKYPFEVRSAPFVEVPEPARILSVQVQGGGPCLWALVDTAGPERVVYLRIFGTGQPIDAAELALMDFVATFQDGPLVWHVFRRRG
jgi:hypothetical protein